MHASTDDSSSAHGISDERREDVMGTVSKKQDDASDRCRTASKRGIFPSDSNSDRDYLSLPPLQVKDEDNSATSTTCRSRSHAVWGLVLQNDREEENSFHNAGNTDSAHLHTHLRRWSSSSLVAVAIEASLKEQEDAAESEACASDRNFDDLDYALGDGAFDFFDDYSCNCGSNFNGQEEVHDNESFHCYTIDEKETNVEAPAEQIEKPPVNQTALHTLQEKLTSLRELSLDDCPPSPDKSTISRKGCHSGKADLAKLSPLSVTQSKHIFD